MWHNCFVISFLIAHCSDKYKTQRICDEFKAVDHSLGTVKPIIDWFVTSKMIKKLYTALYTANVTFFCNELGTFCVNYNNINLENNFMTIVRILLFLLDFGLAEQTKITFKNANHFEKNKGTVNATSVASQNMVMSEGEKKEKEPIFTN